jgi:hypothetical protein
VSGLGSLPSRETRENRGNLAVEQAEAFAGGTRLKRRKMPPVSLCDGFLFMLAETREGTVTTHTGLLVLSAAVSALALLVPHAASAQGQYLGLPTEDYFLEEVDERYPEYTYRIYYSAAEQKQRNEASTGNRFWITDYPAGKEYIVTMGTPVRYKAAPFQWTQQKFLQTGDRRQVAGLTCFVWWLEQIDPRSNTGDGICRTASGVRIMTFYHDGQKRTATVVRLEHQDPSLFRLPEGAIREE